MNKVNIGESTLKDFGNVINEAADILNKGKVAFDNSIPDKTLQVLPYTGQAGALIPSQIGDLNNLTTTAKDNLVNAINEVNDSLSNNTNVVTLDTEQTITGNKFFQTGENAFVRLYPTPTHIETVSDISTTTYSAHLAGRVLAGTENTPLQIQIPADRQMFFSGYSNGFGGVSFEASYFEGHIGSETDFWTNDWYPNIKGVGYSMFQGDDHVFFGFGNVSAKDQATYFDGVDSLSCAIVMHASNGLAFRIGDNGKIYVNDKAKSEFQRVLEIPTTTHLIDQSTNQSINSTKTFTVLPESTVSPSNANHMTNKAYVDSVGNAKVALSGNQTIAGNKTFMGTTTTAALTANGNTALNGNTTFKLIPNCAVKPTGNNHLANKLYVDNLGGVVSSGAAIDFRRGNHFMVNLSANAQISVANWGGIAGKTGTITVLNANRITGFRAPFNFRVAQSGFTGTEVFSYYCYSSGLIRIVRS